MSSCTTYNDLEITSWADWKYEIVVKDEDNNPEDITGQIGSFRVQQIKEIVQRNDDIYVTRNIPIDDRYWVNGDVTVVDGSNGVFEISMDEGTISAVKHPDDMEIRPYFIYEVELDNKPILRGVCKVS
jgi:hypothetical protein